MNRFTTLVYEERLCIVSDLHLGNPAFDQSKWLSEFLAHLSEQETQLCINGDGIDLLYLSVPKFTAELKEILKGLKKYLSRGDRKIYYVIGNHDIYMESFLEDSGIFTTVPFLDVVSGGKRIHIEHSHLYDHFFLYYPRTYIAVTKFLGVLIKIAPWLFNFSFKIEEFISWLKRSRSAERREPAVDDPKYLRIAEELLGRGFDTVVFGHTHRFGVQKMGKGCYANAGSWMAEQVHYLQIDEGDIRLMEWKGGIERTLSPFKF